MELGSSRKGRGRGAEKEGKRFILNDRDIKMSLCHVTPELNSQTPQVEGENRFPKSNGPHLIPGTHVMEREKEL